VLEEKTSDAGLLLASLPHVDATSAGLYQVTELQKTRVSGRDARVIAVLPMDQLRYGYRVWIDEATAMPLKTQLRSSAGQVLEQIVFTDLRLPTAYRRFRKLEPAVDARNLPPRTTPGRSGGFARPVDLLGGERAAARLSD